MPQRELEEEHSEMELDEQERARRAGPSADTLKKQADATQRRTGQADWTDVTTTTDWKERIKALGQMKGVIKGAGPDLRAKVLSQVMAVLGMLRNATDEQREAAISAIEEIDAASPGMEIVVNNAPRTLAEQLARVREQYNLPKKKAEVPTAQ